MTAIIISIFALVVASIALYVALQQWSTTRSELEYRRRKVYIVIRKFLGEVVCETDFSDAQLAEFNDSTSDAEFLFAEAFVDLLRTIRDRALKMRKHRQAYSPLPSGEGRSRHQQAEQAEQEWLMEQIDFLDLVLSGAVDVSLR